VVATKPAAQDTGCGLREAAGCPVMLVDVTTRAGVKPDPEAAQRT
jgi:hypothetical protein